MRECCARQGIISSEHRDSIVNGLNMVLGEILRNQFPWRPELEDIHMNIEQRLFELIGDPALRLHTARSRNDQVALDMRMYVKGAIADVIAALGRVRSALVALAERHPYLPMPGYTHPAESAAGAVRTPHAGVLRDVQPRCRAVWAGVPIGRTSCLSAAARLLVSPILSTGSSSLTSSAFSPNFRQQHGRGFRPRFPARLPRRSRDLRHAPVTAGGGAGAVVV